MKFNWKLKWKQKDKYNQGLFNSDCSCLIIPPLTVIIDQLATDCQNYGIPYVDITAKVFWVFNKIDTQWFYKETGSSLLERLNEKPRVILSSVDSLCNNQVRNISFLFSYTWRNIQIKEVLSQAQFVRGHTVVCVDEAQVEEKKYVTCSASLSQSSLK